MRAKIIIGKNFGDEGKGLAADYFSSCCKQSGSSAIGIRHNGGAQAGHTVDLPDRRFVFSQLSSCSLRGFHTYWADSFLPDLYKLSAETERFRAMNSFLPQIYASPACRCTYIGDVLLNMLLETTRGENRHGSCGMGINEAVVRSAVFPLYLGDIIGQDAAALFRNMRFLQTNWLPQRLSDLHIDLRRGGEYADLLQSETVLRNAAEEAVRNAEMILLRDTDFLAGFDTLVFEGAQGLLLDENYLTYAPHLTSSRTGLSEPARILRTLSAAGISLQTEIVYVTRAYVTRHGAGPLPYEYCDNAPPYGKDDRTNIPNAWQGKLRTAPHGDAASFVQPVLDDLAAENLCADVSLFVTHLNETNGCIVTKDGNFPAETFCNTDVFNRLYFSYSPLADDVTCKKKILSAD